MKLLAILSLALAAGHSSLALAQEPAFPQRPIKLVVGYPAGGSADSIARALSMPLGRAIGQAVVIDNKAGATGTIGAIAVSQAKNDPHTLLLGTVAEAVIVPQMRSKLKYSLSDLQPIGYVGGYRHVLVATGKKPINSVAEIITQAKGQPEKFTFSTGGNGGPPNLAMHYFMDKAGIKLLDVPYKGGSEAQLAVISGEVDLSVSGVPTIAPAVKRGEVRALAVFSDVRDPVLPDVPTMGELLGKDYGATFDNWTVLFAPQGVSSKVLARLAADLRTALDTPEVQQAFQRQGYMTKKLSLGETTSFVNAESKKFGELIGKK